MDPEATIAIDTLATDEVDASRHPMAGSTGRAILKAIGALEDGVIGWSQAIEGLVETSSNLGIIETGAETIRVVLMTRSSKEGMVESVQERMQRTLTASGAQVDFQAKYPGWEADPDSPLLRMTKASYADLFGEPAEVKAIHAGLECGILGQQLPGVSMVSFGPEIRNAHTPDETLVISSVPPFFKLVVEILRRLCD